MSQQRYIPPHRRRDFSGGEGEKQHPSRPRFWKQQDIVVTLKSSSKYPALPGQLIEIKPSSSDILCQKFKLVFQEDKLRELLRWFRNIGREDTKAVLEFPPCLSKGQRKDIHVLADKFGLGTSSQGFGDQVSYHVTKNQTKVSRLSRVVIRTENRCLSVHENCGELLYEVHIADTQFTIMSMRYLCMYTMDVAALGVGKMSLSQDEKRKSDEVWYLVQKFGGKYGKHSHNEINEMILADRLHPDLQDLLDQNQDILAEEFAEKCQITSTRE